MTPLAGQKLLLIGIGFYDYEAAIATEFRALGAEVWIENEQPPGARGVLAPLRRRLSSGGQGAQPALRRHQEAILDRARSRGPLDHVVVIKGTLLDEDFLLRLRDEQPRARLTAYHWDSMARFPDLMRRQALFDRVLTFDHADASQFGFVLRPLFYRPELSRARQSVHRQMRWDSRPASICRLVLGPASSCACADRGKACTRGPSRSTAMLPLPWRAGPCWTCRIHSRPA